MLFLYFFLSISISERFMNLIKEAKKDAAKIQILEEKESMLLPGLHKIEKGSFILEYPLISRNTKEIKGYAIDNDYIAIVPFQRTSLSNDINAPKPVFVDSINQSLHILSKEVESEDDVIIYKNIQMEPFQVFRRINLNIQTQSTDVDFEGKKLTKSFSYNMNWSIPEDGDPMEDGRPLTKPIFGPLEFGVGSYIEASFSAELQASLLDEFFLSMNFRLRGVAGALLKLASINQKIDDINLFSKSISLLTGYSVTVLGYTIGLTGNLGLSVDLKDIEVNFGTDIEYYKGYYFILDKNVYVSKNGLKQSDWRFQMNAVSSESKPLAEIVSQLISDSKVSIRPSVSIEVFLSFVVANNEITRAGISIEPSLPIEFGFSVDKCAFPFLYGASTIQLDAYLTFSGFSVGTFNILPPYTYHKNLFTGPTYKSCLMDPSYNSEDTRYMTQLNNGDVEIGKSFSADSEKEFTIKTNTKSQFCYIYQKDNNFEVSQMKEIENSGTFTTKISNSNYVTRIYKTTIQNPFEVTYNHVQNIFTNEKYVTFMFEYPYVETIPTNAYLILKTEGFIPVVKNEEIDKYTYLIPIFNGINQIINDKSVITIPCRMKLKKNNSKLTIYPLIMSNINKSIYYDPKTPITVPVSSIIRGGCVTIDSKISIDSISDNKKTFIISEFKINEKYSLFIANPTTSISNSYQILFYQDFYIIPQNEFPFRVNLDFWLRANSWGYIDKKLRFYCPRAFNVLIDINQQDLVPLEKDSTNSSLFLLNSSIEVYNSEIIPICNSFSDSYCLNWIEKDLTSYHLLEYQNTDGINSSSHSDLGSGFLFEMVPAGSDYKLIPFWKNWEGNIKLIEEFTSYDRGSITVDRFYTDSAPKYVNGESLTWTTICFKYKNKPVPLGRGLYSISLNTYFSSIGLITPNDGWNPSNLKFLDNGCISVDSQYDNSKITQTNFRYLAEMLRFNGNLVTGLIETNTTLPIMTPRQTNHPTRTFLPTTPPVTEIIIVDDQELEDMDYIDNSSTNSNLLIYSLGGGIVLLTIVMYFVFKKPNPEDEEAIAV